MNIKLLKSDGPARRGSITTEHGEIQTPFFMTIATAGAIKGLSSSQVKDLDAQIVLGNTYHLDLRPGSEVVRGQGGLHKFMNWDGPILTDSGGFQVFSLAHIRSIKEDGVRFSSHLDGKELLISPERSLQIQMNLGADIVMAFDECKAPDTFESVKKSLEMTSRWGERSKTYLKRMQQEDDSLPTKNQQLFGIVQGSIYPELRKQSAEELTKIGFDGYAIGGLSVGEKEEKMYEMIDSTLPYLPEDQPRYLMGVGTPVNIVESVARGVDMFDCVLPTRNARHGHLYTSQGLINIKTEQFKNQIEPLDPNCECPTCLNYSASYIRHLIRCQEIVGMHLAVQHNVHYYLTLMKNIRESIEENRFEAFRQQIRETYGY